MPYDEDRHINFTKSLSFIR